MSDLCYEIECSNNRSVKVPLIEYGDYPIVRSMYFHGSDVGELEMADFYLKYVQKILGYKLIAFRQPCDLVEKRDVARCLVEDYFFTPDSYSSFIPMASGTGAHLLLEMYRHNYQHPRLHRLMQNVRRMVLVSPDLHEMSDFSLSYYRKKIQDTRLQVIVFCNRKQYEIESFHFYKRIFGKKVRLYYLPDNLVKARRIADRKLKAFLPDF